MEPSVLLVERQSELAEQLERSIEQAGYAVRRVANLEAALISSRQRRADVLVVDLGLAEGSEVTSVARAIKRALECRVIFHAEPADADTVALVH